MQCGYVGKYRGKRCKEEALPNSEYCILHIDFPNDEEDFERIARRKEEKVKEKVSKGDFNFEGVKLLKFDFSGIKIGGDVDFGYAESKGDIWLRRAEIEGEVWFFRAKIKGDIRFNGTKIKKDVYFREAEISGNAWFNGVEIEGNAWFDTTEIKGQLTFYNTKFKHPKAQEHACAKAKATFEKLGGREGADYHFYREMEAKRKQKHKNFSLKPILKLIRKLRLEKPLHKYTEFLEKERHIYWGFLELPVQYIFGYGVYPWRVIATWLLTVFSLAFVYWLGHGVEAADSLGGMLILQRSNSSYSRIWWVSSKPRILSRIGKLRSDIWNFHVGCIYCNVRKEIYAVRGIN
jgi:hypothetical protein